MSCSCLKFGHFSSMSGRERLKKGGKCIQGATRPLFVLMKPIFSAFVTLLDAVIVYAPY